MKRLITQALLLLSAGFALTGCGNDFYENDGVEMSTEQFTVKADHWVWNERYDRLEYARSWNKIDRYMYEEGVVNCGVYVWETTEDGRNDYEVLRSLPFVHTYPDRSASSYTVTIGYDISPGFITFYIQDSDLSQLVADQDYTFKISLFWQE